jgi:hypothetical protein
MGWSSSIPISSASGSQPSSSSAAWFVPEQRWRMAVRDLALQAGGWPVIGTLVGRGLGFVRSAV